MTKLKVVFYLNILMETKQALNSSLIQQQVTVWTDKIKAFFDKECDVLIIPTISRPTELVVLDIPTKSSEPTLLTEAVVNTPKSTTKTPAKE